MVGTSGGDFCLGREFLNLYSAGLAQLVVAIHS